MSEYLHTTGSWRAFEIALTDDGHAPVAPSVGFKLEENETAGDRFISQPTDDYGAAYRGVVADREIEDEDLSP